MTLRVDPRFGFAPLTIKVQIRAEDVPPASGLILSVYGNNGYQAISVLEFEEGRERVTVPDRFYNLSEAGVYQVDALLVQGDFLLENGQIQMLARATSEVIVS